MATPTKASRKSTAGSAAAKKSPTAAIKKPMAKSAGASSGGVLPPAKPIGKATKTPTAKAAKGGGSSKTR
jgi:hypothetical protein